MPERSESQLLAACRARRAGAFAELYAAYKGQAYALALAMTGRADLAEDVTQQAFVRVHRSLAQFREDSRFGTWLHRIVANLSIDLRRKESASRFVPLEEAAPRDLVAPESADERTLAADRAAILYGALATLSPQAREALLLKYFCDMSYDEIAELQQCSRGTVGSRIHRGLTALREHLHGTDEHV